MSNSDDGEGKAMAKDDRCWDGNWLIDGLNGMVMKLDGISFLEEQLQEFQEEQEESGGKLQMEHEFLNLEGVIQAGEGNLEENWSKLQFQQLQPRNLHLADAVTRRAAEGECPPRIRIRKLEPEEMKDLLEAKQKGNQAFGKKNFQEAIDHYEEALMLVDDMFVGPKDQIEQIVAILSNQAECHLRLKEFRDAGSAATNALVFDNGHEKSRMRRVKAELAIAGTSYLVQALIDLEEIINEHHSAVGVKQAKELVPQVKELLEMEKKTFKRQRDASDADWDLYVRMLRSTCW